MELSIITLTWNSEKYIEKMLSSLISELKKINYKFEILIVDNGSNDNTLNIISRYKEANRNIQLFEMKENMGTTKPRNMAINRSNYENILIVDSDTDFAETDFEKLLNSFSVITNEKVGIVQPQLVHTDGNIQYSALEFPTIKNKFLRFLGHIHSPYNLNYTQKVDYCISAAWLLKKETFDKVGLLDENIFYAPEDAEFCKRLTLNGYSIWYYPEVKITHHYQRITSKKKFTKMWFRHLHGLLYFWFKYGLK